MARNNTIKELILNLHENLNHSMQLLNKAKSIAQSLNLSSFENHSSDSEENECKESREQLKINERVVWMVRDQPDLGTVRWVGMMSDGLVAGIEFDEPIGNSDGNLDGKRLFVCKPRHGRFVLVRELILWSDFSGERVK